MGFTQQPRGVLSDLAFQLANSPRMKPGAGSMLAPMGSPEAAVANSTPGASAAAGVLGDINSAKSTYDKGNSLYQGLLGDSSLSAAGSGALANGALADAGFGAGWSTPLIDTGASAAGVGAGLSAVGGTGTGALGASTFSEFSPSAAAAIDSAAGGAGASGGALASSGLSTALPIAAIGWAAADALNKSGDAKSAGTSALVGYMSQNQGWKLVNPKNQTYQLPDGRYIQVGNKARAASEALRNGDTSAYQSAFDAWLASADSDYNKAVRNGS
jgi:hypothetical protein